MHWCPTTTGDSFVPDPSDTAQATGTFTHPRRGNDYVWQLHVRGKFAAPFRLHSFPIDVQELGIHFQSRYSVLVPGPQVSTKQCLRFVVADRADPTPTTIVRQGVIISPLLCRLLRLSVQVGHTPQRESKRGNIYSKGYACVVSCPTQQRSLVSFQLELCRRSIYHIFFGR